MPYTLNGTILAATGGPTVNEGQLKWFQNHGAPGVVDYNDAERKFLEVSTATAANTLTVADLWRKLLVAGSYWKGDMNDAMLAYWVAQASQAPAVTFTGTPLSVASGGSVTLNWNVDGATTITASAVPANGQWTGAKAAVGSQVITNVTAGTVFTLAATNASGTTTVNVTVTVTALTANLTLTVGQDATPDYFGFNALAGYGACVPVAIFGGTMTVLVGGWNGFDEILVANTGNVVFPQIGTSQLQLSFPAGGANSGPFTLTWNGTVYRLASSVLAYYLTGKVGQQIQAVLTKL